MVAEAVRQLVRRAVAAALDAGGVLYAVIGGNAVGEWVGRIDDGMVRNTRDVDILLRRGDLPAADAAMAAAGFVRADDAGIPIYLNGPDGMPSKGIHVILANEKVRETDAVPAPDVTDSERALDFQVVALEGLVRMKLVAHRLKDQVHLRDFLGVGLIDATWPARFPPPLDARLQHVLDTPDG